MTTRAFNGTLVGANARPRATSGVLCFRTIDLRNGTVSQINGGLTFIPPFVRPQHLFESV